MAQQLVFYGVFIPLLVILLLFPTGTLLSSRWRFVLIAVVASGGLADRVGDREARVRSTRTSPRSPTPRASRPRVGQRRVRPWIAGRLLVLGAIGSVAAVVVRYRRAAGDERQQIRSLAWLAAIAVVLADRLGLTLQSVFPVVGSIGFTALFAVIGIGVPLAVQIRGDAAPPLRPRRRDQEDGGVRDRRRAAGRAWPASIAVLVGLGIVPSLSDSPALMLFARGGVRLMSPRRTGSRLASPTGSCTAGGRPRTRCSASSPDGCRRPTPPTTCCRGWPRARGGSHRGEARCRVWLRVSGVYAGGSWPRRTCVPEDPVVDPEDGMPGSRATTIAGGARQR